MLLICVESFLSDKGSSDGVCTDLTFSVMDNLPFLVVLCCRTMETLMVSIDLRGAKIDRILPSDKSVQLQWAKITPES